jgi:outer membrane autotransporter protein
MNISKKFSFFFSTLLYLSPFSTEAAPINSTMTNPQVGGTLQWTAAVNWSPPIYPGSPDGGDIANFPSTVRAQQIVSTILPITLQDINFNMSNLYSLRVSLQKIIFRSNPPGQVSLINVQNGDPQFFPQPGPDSTIQLQNPLLVVVGRPGPRTAGINISYSIQGGSHPVTFTINSPNAAAISGVNTGTGTYTIERGALFVASPGGAIPRDAVIRSGATFIVANPNANQFNIEGNVTVNRATLALRDSSVQAFNSLTLFENGVVNGGLPSLLTLHSSTTALSMKKGSFLASNLVLQNGGAIAYDPTLQGNGSAIIGGEDHRTTIDLNGHNVILAVGDGSPAIAEPFDLELFNVDVINGSLTKTLTGTLLFAGNNSVPSLAINGGEVIIGRTPGETVTFNNSLLTVNPGTILGGFGTLTGPGSGALVRNLGLVEPGSPAQLGTLTIAGTYLQEPSGTLLIRALNRSTSHLIVTGGPVLLNGTLAVTGTNVNFQNGDRIVIIDNSLGTGISGRFSSFVENVTNDLLAKYVITPNQVLLEFFNSPEPEIGAAETAEITLVEGHTLNVLSRLRAVRYRSEGYEFVSPPDYQVEADHPRKTISLRKTRSEIYNPVAVSDDEQITAGRFWKKPFETPASVYIAPLGSWGRVDKINVQEGYKFDSIGGLIGGDYAFDRAGVGALLGYEGLHGTVQNTFGTFRLKSAFGELYGTFLPLKNRNLFIDLILGGSRNWYTFNRQSSCFVARGTPKGWEYDAYAGIGYDFNIKKEWRFTPIFGFQYINTSIDEFSEEGAFDENLDVGSQRMHSSRTWLGASFGGKLNRNKVIWMPEVRGFWQHEFAPLSHCLTVTSPCYCFCENLRIFTGERNYGDLGGELRVLFGQRYNWSIAGAYDYFWSRSSHTNYLYGELGYNF